MGGWGALDQLLPTAQRKQRPGECLYHINRSLCECMVTMQYRLGGQGLQASQTVSQVFKYCNLLHLMQAVQGSRFQTRTKFIFHTFKLTSPNAGLTTFLTSKRQESITYLRPVLSFVLSHNAKRMSLRQRELCSLVSVILCLVAHHMFLLDTYEPRAAPLLGALACIDCTHVSLICLVSLVPSRSAPRGVN